MNNALRVLLIVIVIFILLGFVRGWFSLTGNQDVQTDRVNVNLTIDADKMKADANRVGDAASDLTSGKSTSKERPESNEPESNEPESKSRPEPDPASDQDSAFPSRPVSPEIAK